MKLKKAFKTATALIFGLGLPFSTNAQTYHFSTFIGSVGMGISLSDSQGTGSGSISYNSGTLTETVYVDTGAATVRQVGSIQLNPAPSNFHFQETNIVGQFPNSHQETADIYISLNPIASQFDTGPQKVSVLGGAFAIANTGFKNTFSVAGSYTLITGGQSYSGALDFDLSTLYGGSYLYTFNSINT